MAARAIRYTPKDLRRNRCFDAIVDRGTEYENENVLRSSKI
jgi:hypothetical protein